MIPGIYFSVSKEDVLKKDITTLKSTVDNTASLTAQHNKMFFIELMFDGFDEDTRPVYAIPEIISWIQKAKNELRGELAFWLTPGAMLRYYLTINPTWWKQLPNGSIEYEIGSSIGSLHASSALAASTRLVKAGVALDNVSSLSMASIQNMQEMLMGEVELGSHYGVFFN